MVHASAACTGVRLRKLLMAGLSDSDSENYNTTTMRAVIQRMQTVSGAAGTEPSVCSVWLQTTFLVCPLSRF